MRAKRTVSIYLVLYIQEERKHSSQQTTIQTVQHITVITVLPRVLTHPQLLLYITCGVYNILDLNN